MNQKDSELIQREIDKFKPVKIEEPGNQDGNLGFNIAVELISFGMIGMLVGIILDHIFNTKAIFVVVSVMISLIACLKLIYIKYIRRP